MPSGGDDSMSINHNQQQENDFISEESGEDDDGDFEDDEEFAIDDEEDLDSFLREHNALDEYGQVINAGPSTALQQSNVPSIIGTSNNEYTGTEFNPLSINTLPTAPVGGISQAPWTNPTSTTSPIILSNANAFQHRAHVDNLSQGTLAYSPTQPFIPMDADSWLASRLVESENTATFSYLHSTRNYNQTETISEPTSTRAIWPSTATSDAAPSSTATKSRSRSSASGGKPIGRLKKKHLSEQNDQVAPFQVLPTASPVTDTCLPFSPPSQFRRMALPETMAGGTTNRRLPVLQTLPLVPPPLIPPPLSPTSLLPEPQLSFPIPTHTAEELAEGRQEQQATEGQQEEQAVEEQQKQQATEGEQEQQATEGQQEEQAVEGQQEQQAADGLQEQQVADALQEEQAAEGQQKQRAAKAKASTLPPSLTPEQMEFLRSVFHEQTVHALEANRSYQRTIKFQMQKVQEAQNRNKAKQDECMELRAMQLRARQKPVLLSTSNSRFGPPYFIDKNNQVPPENEDAMARANRAIGISQNSARWSKQERMNLREGVIAENKRLLFEMVSKTKSAAAIEFLKKIPDLEMTINTKGLNWHRIAERF
ncbi:hypothetical protein BG004_001977, partial [Podila humilis]